MTEQTEKPVRVQFGKELGSKGIVDAIRQIQNRWAKANPEEAHRLYPKVFDINGNRIKPV